MILTFPAHREITITVRTRTQFEAKRIQKSTLVFHEKHVEEVFHRGREGQARLHALGVSVIVGSGGRFARVRSLDFRWGFSLAAERAGN